MKIISIRSSRADFPLGLLQAAWDAGAGWICVLLVGLAAGATAGIIDIGARWMSDLKVGFVFTLYIYLLGWCMRRSLLA